MRWLGKGRRKDVSSNRDGRFLCWKRLNTRKLWIKDVENRKINSDLNNRKITEK